MAAGLPGEAVDHAETEPGALADRLGAEERLERMAQHLGRHAGTGVADRDHHVRPRRDVERVGCVIAAERHVGRLDLEPPAARHRIARVDRKVDQCVFELVAVDARVPCVAGRQEFDLDAGPERAPEKLAAILHQPVDIGDRRIDRLAAREGQQPGSQFGASLPGAPYRFQHPDRGVVTAHPVESQPAIADDHGQHVVEVVRNAAGELAKRVELLHLAQFFLRLARGGDIGQDLTDPQRVAVAVEPHREPGGHDAPRHPVGEGDLAFALQHAAGLQRPAILLRFCGDALACVRGDVVGQGHPLPDPPVAEPQPSFRIAQHEAGRQIVDHRPELRLAAGELGERRGVGAARRGDPHAGERQQQRHAGGRSKHGVELGVPAVERVVLCDRDRDHEGAARQGPPGGQVMGTAGVERGVSKAAHRTRLQRVEDRTAAGGRTGQVPPVRLAEQQVAVGMQKRDQAVRSDIDHVIEAAQPLRLEGGRNETDIFSLCVVQRQADRDAHPVDEFRRCGRADDEVVAGRVLQATVQVVAAARRAGHRGVGRPDHRALGIEHVERADARESRQGGFEHLRPFLWRRSCPADPSALRRDLADRRLDGAEGALEMFRHYMRQVFRTALRIGETAVELPPQQPGATDHENGKDADQRVEDLAAELIGICDLRRRTRHEALCNPMPAQPGPRAASAQRRVASCAPDCSKCVRYPMELRALGESSRSLAVLPAGCRLTHPLLWYRKEREGRGVSWRAYRC